MRVFTVLGPSQSGKTALVGAMVGLEPGTDKSLDASGSATVRRFTFMEEDWAAIDIPGGADTLAQAGPALAASDAAVVCVPAEADAAALAAPYLRLVEEAGIPSLIFVNKVDRAAGRMADIISALQTYCSHSIVLRQVPMREGEDIVGAVDLISERAWKYNEGEPSSLIEIPDSLRNREQEARTELLESLSDFDDALLEQLIEDKQPMAAEVFDLAGRVLQHTDLIPALMGSAEHGNGVFRLMKALRHEAPGVEAARARLEDTPLAVGAVADLVKHLGKTVLIRALGDGVAAGSALGGGSIGSITDLDGKSQIQSLAPGRIGLTVKSDHLDLGYSFTADGRTVLPGWAQARRPAFKRIITPQNERDEARLSSAIEQLCAIDPGLVAEHGELTGHIVLGTQGPLHLRRVLAKLSGGLGIEVDPAQVPPALRETITKRVEHQYRHRKQSGGAGQFADVTIEIKPRPRGEGFLFEEVIKGGVVPRNHIPSVETGARDSLVEGPNGLRVIDVHVLLKDGKHHAVDSSDHAFRMAGRTAVREALVLAGPIVLQPIMKVDIHVLSIYSGGLVQTISGMKGQVLGFEGHGSAPGWDVFACHLPMAAHDDLFNALGSATRGTAWFDWEFDHYQEARKGEIQGYEAAMAATA